jgi:hypothetical protein
MKLIKLHRLSSVECGDDFEGLWSWLLTALVECEDNLDRNMVMAFYSGGESGNMKKTVKNATVWLLFGGMAQ